MISTRVSECMITKSEWKEVSRSIKMDEYWFHWNRENPSAKKPLKPYTHTNLLSLRLCNCFFISLLLLTECVPWNYWCGTPTPKIDPRKEKTQKFTCAEFFLPSSNFSIHIQGLKNSPGIKKRKQWIGDQNYNKSWEPRNNFIYDWSGG